MGCGSKADSAPATSLHGGAATSDPLTSESPVDSTIQAVSQVADLLQVLGLTSEQGNVIRAGLDAKISECMREQGFDYAGSGGPVDLTPVPTVPTADEVALYGYNWRVRRFAERSGSNSGPVTTLSPEGQAALDGTSDVPGCGSVAAVFLDLDRLNEMAAVISSAASDITRRALADPTYLAGIGSWVECMAAFGYAVPNPDDAPVQASSLPGGLESADAIAMAVRDYGCRESAGLDATLSRLVSTGTQQWLEGNPSAIDDYRRLVAEVVANAQAATG